MSIKNQSSRSKVRFSSAFDRSRRSKSNRHRRITFSPRALFGCLDRAVRTRLNLFEHGTHPSHSEALSRERTENPEQLTYAFTRDCSKKPRTQTKKHELTSSWSCENIRVSYNVYYTRVVVWRYRRIILYFTACNTPRNPVGSVRTQYRTVLNNKNEFVCRRQQKCDHLRSPEHLPVSGWHYSGSRSGVEFFSFVHPFSL